MQSSCFWSVWAYEMLLCTAAIFVKVGKWLICASYLGSKCGAVLANEQYGY